jgi:hypothetical protein
MLFDSRLAKWSCFLLNHAGTSQLKKGCEKLHRLALGCDSIRKHCSSLLQVADLVALAGARAVKVTGGPDIKVPLGKRSESHGSWTELGPNFVFCVSSSPLSEVDCRWQ